MGDAPQVCAALVRKWYFLSHLRLKTEVSSTSEKPHGGAGAQFAGIINFNISRKLKVVKMCETGKLQTDEKKIQLTLLNGTGYVFDVGDYMKIRTQHRIMGALVGTSSNKGWSASECTLPVALTQNETRLLIAKGIAELVSKQASLLKVPTPKELSEYEEQFEVRIAAQADDLKAEKLREAERNMEKILLGKRKKLMKSGKVAEAESLNANDVLKEIAENLKFDRKNALVEITCAHARKHSVEIVQMPPDNSLKYRVFRDCWQRGKFVTCGDAFGADFLLYPGDPVLYHASHIVILLDKPTLHPLELIAKVRLSVIVNKLCVVAYFEKQKNDDESDAAIHYQTISWEGNRDRQHGEAVTSIVAKWQLYKVWHLISSITINGNSINLDTDYWQLFSEAANKRRQHFCCYYTPSKT